MSSLSESDLLTTGSLLDQSSGENVWSPWTMRRAVASFRIETFWGLSEVAHIWRFYERMRRHSVVSIDSGSTLTMTSWPCSVAHRR